HHGEGLLVQGHARADHEVLLRDVIRRVHDEVRTRRRLDDNAAVGQDVPDVADDQRRALEPVQFLFQPSDLLLESDELRVGVPLRPSTMPPVIAQRLEARQRRLTPRDVYAQAGELELMEDFPQMIRQARESRGWKQADLGAKINERASVIAKLESGTITPGDD